MAGFTQKIHSLDQLVAGQDYTIYSPTARQDERESMWRWGRYTGTIHNGKAVFHEILRSGLTTNEITSTVVRDSCNTYYPVYAGLHPAR